MLDKAIQFVLDHDMTNTRRGKDMPEKTSDVQLVIDGLLMSTDRLTDKENEAFDNGYNAGYLQALLEKEYK